MNQHKETCPWLQHEILALKMGSSTRLPVLCTCPDERQDEIQEDTTSMEDKLEALEQAPHQERCNGEKWVKKNKIDDMCVELETILKNCTWNTVARDHGLQLVPAQFPIAWLRVTLSQLRQETIAECVATLPKERELPRRLECVDCVHLMKDLDRDDMRCATCNGERGYNQALADVRTEVEKLLKP